MKTQTPTRDELLTEIRSLRERLREAEDTLEAIRSGGVDALVVAGPQGDRVYTLSGAAEPYRILIEEMNQGAATLSEEGVILYCNPLFAELVGAPLERVMGAAIESYIVSADQEKLAALLQTGCGGRGAEEVTLQTASGNTVPVRLAVSCLPPHAGAAVCLVATSLAGERGRELTLLGMMDDVRRAKLAAEAERRRFFDVLETLPTMICLLTPDHHVPFANRAFRNRFGEPQGRHCYEACFGRTAPCEFCEAFKVLETGAPHRWELDLADGSLLDIFNFPFTDENGSRIVLEMELDITEQRANQEKLHQAYAYNRSLIEASLDPLVTIGPDGKITDVNVATEQATGCTRPELIGTDFSDYFTEPEKARAGYRQVFREGFVKDYELELRHRDGHVTAVLYNASVYRDEQGKVTGVFAAARDITGRKKAEAEIRQLNANLEERVVERAHELKLRTQELETILNMVPVGVSIAYDVGAHHILGNPALEQLVGMPPGGELSVTAAEPPAYRVQRAGSDLSPSELPMQRACRGEVVSGYVMEIVRPDGLASIVLCNATPLLDENGQPRGAVGAFMDVTELKRIEEALRQSEERFRTVYDMAPVSIWQEDWTDVIAMIRPLRKEGVTDFAAWFRGHPEFVARALAAVKILDINQWTVGMFKARDKGDLLASLEKVFATPGTLEGFIGELVALAQGQAVYRTEMDLNTVTGEQICGLLAMSFPPLESGSGSVLVSVIDITTRKQAEEQIQKLNEELRRRATELETANKELESFSYSVSHDLRTPLRSIDGFSRLLLEQEKEKLDAKGQDHLKRIRAATQRMGHLIDDLLMLSAVTRQDFKSNHVNLSLLAQGIVVELQKEDPERRVEWRITPGMWAHGDAHLLSIMLENLLRNAWKFTGRQAAPLIEFGKTQRNGIPMFFVRDNGAGFDMTYAGKLFGPFQRLHSVIDFPGTGIGLALVKRVIHRHGGTIEAESQVHEGATFYFTLPADEPKSL